MLSLLQTLLKTVQDVQIVTHEINKKITTLENNSDKLSKPTDKQLTVLKEITSEFGTSCGIDKKLTQQCLRNPYQQADQGRDKLAGYNHNMGYNKFMILPGNPPRLLLMFTPKFPSNLNTKMANSAHIGLAADWSSLFQMSGTSFTLALW